MGMVNHVALRLHLNSGKVVEFPLPDPDGRGAAEILSIFAKELDGEEWAIISHTANPVAVPVHSISYVSAHIVDGPMPD